MIHFAQLSVYLVWLELTSTLSSRSGTCLTQANQHIPGHSDYLMDWHVTYSEPMRSHESFTEISER